MSARPVLRGAILGYGNVASEGHMPVWSGRHDFEIVAAVDADAQRRRTFETASGGRAYADVEAMLAGERLDFVDICTPPNSHAVLAERALAAGLHVLCEKPLTTSEGDALRLAQAASRAARAVQTVHNWLEAPVCRQVSSLIASGEVGEVRSVRWATLRTRPAVTVSAEPGANWRLDPVVAGGGILLDHGWHAAYCVAHWAGQPLEAVAARLETRRFHELNVEDTAMVDLAFAGGARGHIHLTWAAEERSNQLEIEGEQGRIFVEGEQVVLQGSGGERRWPCPPALSQGSHHPDWFSRVIDGFGDAISGRAKGNLGQALICAAIMERAKRSSAQGGAWLRIEAARALAS